MINLIIEINSKKIVCAVPTSLGKDMIKLPLSPRYSIMILKALEFYKSKKCDLNILYYITILVSSFSVRVYYQLIW